MHEEIKFVKNTSISINNRHSSFDISHRVFKPTESFLAKIKNKMKIVKNSSQKFTNLFGKVNQNNNEEFNFLDYKNYVSDNLIKYLTDINHYKTQLKQINKTFIKFSKLLFIKRRMRPYYLCKSNNTNISTERFNKKSNMSNIRLIETKNKSQNLNEIEKFSPQNLQGNEVNNNSVKVRKILEDPSNESSAFEKDHLNKISFNTLQNQFFSNHKTLDERNKIFNKASNSYSKRKSNTYFLSRIDYNYHNRINNKCKEKLKEINYCISKAEATILKNKSAPFINENKSILS